MLQKGKRLRVLIVEDSPIYSEVMVSIVGSDPALQVVGVAPDGLQAVKMAEALEPDVITMDLHMPVLDGLEAVEQIMARRPKPILMVTGDPRAEGEDLAFEALRRGALDLMSKPTGAEGSLKLRERLKLLAEVAVVRHAGPRGGRAHRTTPLPLPPLSPPAPRRAGSAELRRLDPELPARPAETIVSAGRVVGIVASTGGPAALANILEQLPSSFAAPILITQHVAVGFAESLAKWLDSVCPMPVRVACHGAALEPGRILVAPDGCHLTVGPAAIVALAASPPLDGHQPSGSALLASLARSHGRRAIGVILTGMGRDGVAGLQAIRAAGGTTVAQDESSAVVYGMPRVARETGAAEHVLGLPQIAQLLRRLVGSSGAP